MHRGASRYAGCLLAVFETVLILDERAVAEALAAEIGVGTDEWVRALEPMLAEVNDGRLDLGQAFGRALRACERPHEPAAVRQLLDDDRRLRIERSRVDDDVVPFLAELRGRSVGVALIENGAENIRALVEHHGLTELVDEVVLSCEVGVVKPDAAVFRAALAGLGVDPRATLLVDGRPDHCRGAMGLRIDAVVMNRAGWGPDAAARTDGLPSVQTLAELLHRF